MAKPGTFPPGTTGNPNGRPKTNYNIRALAREHTPDAIAALVSALKVRGERVHAANALLDRGYGKPGQTIDLNHHIPVATSDDAALLSIALAGRGAAAAQAGDTEESGGLVH